MTNVNVTNFRKDIYELLDQTIKYNEPINISTKNGNAIVLSEEDYNNIMETLYISSIPGLKEDIIKGLKEPIDECVDEKEVKW
jgi:antitoxin YefM